MRINADCKECPVRYTLTIQNDPLKKAIFDSKAVQNNFVNVEVSRQGERKNIGESDKNDPKKEDIKVQEPNNPSGTSQAEAQYMFNAWNWFSKARPELKGFIWNLQMINHSIQNLKIDTVNCGVYVCYFAKQLVENGSLVFENTLPNLANARQAIEKILEDNASL